MAEAAHITTGRTHGAKAGFKQYRSNLKRITDDGTKGLPQVLDRYNEMIEQGDTAAQFAWYCREYATQLGLKASKAKVPAKAKSGTGNAVDINAIAQNAVAAALAALGQVAEVEEIDEDDDLDEIDNLDEIDEPEQVTTGRKAAPATKKAKVRYAPKHPEDNATNGKLWRLNELGLLNIRKSPGTPLTNGEAHEVLAANL